MAEEAITSDRVIDSVADLRVGDGLYSEASETPYWVIRITHERVVLRDRRNAPHHWVRETFEASLEAHTWIHQTRVPPG